MRLNFKSLLLGLALGTIASNAFSAETSHCELLLVQIVQSPDGKGEAQVPSYIPAEEFMATLTDDEPGHMTDYLGHKIQAVMCRRDDIIPAEEDYTIISTGIPFILSQDFDSTDTDSLTLYWKDEAVRHVYKGYPLSEETESILKIRLAEFSKQGVVAVADITPELETEAEAKTEAEPKTDIQKSEENISEIVVLPTNTQADTQSETEDALEFEPSIDVESNSESEE